ncbi:YggU family protein [Candidatus Desantisbacteria bacterium]|nr:YggU family protein [Candidatus Desantisbacteria bacterium]
MLTINENGDGVTFRIRVQPKSSRTEIYGIVNETIKLRLAAPPTDNKANLECIAFLSKKFCIPKSSIQILQGQKSREKIIKIFGVNKGELEKMLSI